MRCSIALAALLIAGCETCPQSEVAGPSFATPALFASGDGALMVWDQYEYPGGTRTRLARLDGQTGAFTPIATIDPVKWRLLIPSATGMTAFLASGRDDTGQWYVQAVTGAGVVEPRVVLDPVDELGGGVPTPDGFLLGARLGMQLQILSADAHGAIRSTSKIQVGSRPDVDGSVDVGRVGDQIWFVYEIADPTTPFGVSGPIEAIRTDLHGAILDAAPLRIAPGGMSVQAILAADDHGFIILDDRASNAIALVAIDATGVGPIQLRPDLTPLDLSGEPSSVAGGPPRAFPGAGYLIGGNWVGRDGANLGPREVVAPGQPAHAQYAAATNSDLAAVGDHGLETYRESGLPPADGVGEATDRLWVRTVAFAAPATAFVEAARATRHYSLVEPISCPSYD